MPEHPFITPSARAILTPSPGLPQACRAGRALRQATCQHPTAHVAVHAKKDDTHHMSCAAHRRKRQRARALGLARLAPVNGPVAHLLARVLRRARPLELVEPEFVRDPVALPVVRARVDEDAYAALEQPSDVVLRWDGVLVEMRGEPAADVQAAGGEVPGRLDPQETARGRAVEEVADHGRLEVAEAVPDAVLYVARRESTYVY